jgi:hypothetical protein
MTAAVLIAKAGRYGADLYQPAGLRLAGRKREGNAIADLFWAVRHLEASGVACLGLLDRAKPLLLRDWLVAFAFTCANLCKRGGLRKPLCNCNIRGVRHLDQKNTFCPFYNWSAVIEPQTCSS